MSPEARALVRVRDDIIMTDSRSGPQSGFRGQQGRVQKGTGNQVDMILNKEARADSSGFLSGSDYGSFW